VSRILITGLSGAGKSTLLEELVWRGHAVVDTDYDGWTLPTGLWDEPRVEALMQAKQSIVVSGAVDNQGRFYPYFEYVILLSAPIDVLLDRVSTRTNNPFGKSREEQDQLRRYAVEVEPLLRAGATLELDSRRTTVDLADEIENLPEEARRLL
jgi:shikimate kinase